MENLLVMPKTICLNMIVKNESAAIARCLKSVKPLISHWVIVDTGSTDNTQAIIRDTMKGIPGELVERPWVDFAHNRNEALTFAKGKGDYVFFIDADDVLQISENFVLPELDTDYYLIDNIRANMSRLQPHLVNNQLDWRWEGAIYETLHIPLDRTSAYLPGIMVLHNVSNKGFRSKDPKRYLKDAELLMQLLKKDPNNTWYQFSLAECYNNAYEHKLALQNYEKRASMGGSRDEIFWSMLQIGILSEVLKMPASTAIDSFKKAHKLLPSRAEPLYYLSRHFTNSKNYVAGYDAALKGLSIPKPIDTILTYNWIYEYGLLLQLATSARALGQYEVAKSAFGLLLSNPKLPPHVQPLVKIQLTVVENALKDTIT
jgi:glycosyltransferase involved in cell wall biosynthesis